MFLPVFDPRGGARCAPVLVLCCSLLGFCQQAPPKSGAVFPSGHTDDIADKRNRLRSQAKQLLDSEMAREKAGDCPDAVTTYESNACYSKAVTASDQSLKTYEGTIRALLALEPTLEGPTRGPAGPVLTPQEDVDEFDHMEQLWHGFLDAAATTAFHQFGGGTGGPSFGMETHLRLVRGHMQELNDIYALLLSH
jgi:hypothetical protein